MAKYRVYLSTVVSLSATVDVPDDVDEDEARETAVNEALDMAPTGLCAQCSGWGQPWGLDLGEWEVEKDLDGKETQPERQG